MRKNISTLTIVLALASVAPVSVMGQTAGAGIPTYDTSRAVDFVTQLGKVKEQIDTAKSQLQEAQELYSSVTGSRGFGDVLRNPELREFLPENMQDVYDSVQGGGYSDISGSIGEILDAEKLDGNVEDLIDQIGRRSREAGATNKAIGQRAYEGAQQRLAQIDGLMDQIEATQDQKGIEELQARLAGEQAAIANENAKLKMLAQLQASEDRLIDQQRDALNQRILNSDNEGMPKLE